MDLLPNIYTHRFMYKNNTNTNTTTNNNYTTDNHDNEHTTNMHKTHHHDPISMEYCHNYNTHLQTLASNRHTQLIQHISTIPNPIYHYFYTFYQNRVETRRQQIDKVLHEIIQIAEDILHEVELQEPRFISTLKLKDTMNGTSRLEQQKHEDRPSEHDTDSHDDVIDNGNIAVTAATTTTSTTATDCVTSSNEMYYDGLRVLSSNHFEITLYLNQMGVFNFIDDGTIPGGAVLKLSDGRKRSMSLWVEFITASGYLSARKIRARFHSLIGQAIQKSAYRHIVRMLGQTTEVRLCIHDKYILQITPGFRCKGLWPRSANQWPITNHLNTDLMHSNNANLKWPPNQLINEVKYEGFCLLSQESIYTKDKQSSVEGDTWLLDFYHAEERLLLNHTIRRQCYSILKTLADRHLTGTNDEINSGKNFKLSSAPSTSTSLSACSIIKEYDIKTLVLHECEKHPNDEDWTQFTLSDRINGILLQLISCLQHRRCPHYFLPNLNIFQGYSTVGMDITAKQTWNLLRELLTCPQALEYL
ncbi:unnamed protein product [Schistosoma turkestanicum]|nr:unnamed protein product [Schistosoma turkestanicum]